ncbi:ribonuclease III [Gammaproteobacteria bacterium]|nr:ribonuclease III [Gammaproteobacteria bacterium]
MFRKLRTFFNKTTPYQLQLKKLIGYLPQDVRYYKLAFSHSSKIIRDKYGRKINNERLEYLGDAVLETCISDILYRQFPDKQEGFLSEARSTLVRRTTLNKIGKSMSLEQFLNYVPTSNESNIYGNAFEALVGALYLESGFENTLNVLIRIYAKHLNIQQFLRKSQNFKSQLLEICQRERWECEFTLVDEERLQNNQINFAVEVLVDGRKLGHGVGLKKRIAEQNASKLALTAIRRKRK